MPYTVSANVQPSNYERLEVVHQQRQFARMNINVEKVLTRTSEGYTKIVLSMDVFSRFVRAVVVRDEKGKTVDEMLIVK